MVELLHTRHDISEYHGDRLPVEIDHFIPQEDATGTYRVYGFEGAYVNMYLVAGQPYPGRGVWNIKDSSGVELAAGVMTVVL